MFWLFLGCLALVLLLGAMIERSPAAPGSHRRAGQPPRRPAGRRSRRSSSTRPVRSRVGHGGLLGVPHRALDRRGQQRLVRHRPGHRDLPDAVPRWCRLDVGTLLGGAFYVAIPQILSSIQRYDTIVYGGLLLVVVLALPDGIVGGRPAAPRRRLGEDRSRKPPVLTADDISVAFGGVRAVSGVSLPARRRRAARPRRAERERQDHLSQRPLRRGGGPRDAHRGGDHGAARAAEGSLAGRDRPRLPGAADLRGVDLPRKRRPRHLRHAPVRGLTGAWLARPAMWSHEKRRGSGAWRCSTWSGWLTWPLRPPACSPTGNAASSSWPAPSTATRGPAARRAQRRVERQRDVGSGELLREVRSGGHLPPAGGPQGRLHRPALRPHRGSRARSGHRRGPPQEVWRDDGS